ncbi:MAG: hypothetical protein RIF37_07475 [Rhodospirillaceae bacterium]
MAILVIAHDMHISGSFIRITTSHGDFITTAENITPTIINYLAFAPLTMPGHFMGRLGI